MDEQRIQQNSHAKTPLRVHVVKSAAPKASTGKRGINAGSGLAMLVNVIPRDEDMPGFVRGYN